MPETPVRKRRGLCLTIAAGFAAAILFSSCATERPRTALINDPDSQTESSIPWNKPARWENGSAFPGGLGGAGGAFGNALPGDPGSPY